MQIKHILKSQIVEGSIKGFVQRDFKDLVLVIIFIYFGRISHHSSKYVAVTLYLKQSYP